VDGCLSGGFLSHAQRKELCAWHQFCLLESDKAHIAPDSGGSLFGNLKCFWVRHGISNIATAGVVQRDGLFLSNIPDSEPDPNTKNFMAGFVSRW
jgi:hypothetical protein